MSTFLTLLLPCPSLSARKLEFFAPFSQIQGRSVLCHTSATYPQRTKDQARFLSNVVLPATAAAFLPSNSEFRADNHITASKHQLFRLRPPDPASTIAQRTRDLSSH